MDAHTRSQSGLYLNSVCKVSQTQKYNTENSVIFSDLIAQDNRVTTEVDGIFNQATSARFWNTDPGTYPETNEYHFTIRVTSEKMIPAEITSAYFCGEY